MTLAEQVDALVVDIRFSPRSRIAHWSGGRLAKLPGNRYYHLPALGNRNYKGGPVDIVDLEGGMAQVAALLARQPVILLCVCSDLHRCHRLLVAEAVAARSAVQVIHR
jgi:uncharacterized protein (DUF488 family)